MIYPPQHSVASPDPCPYPCGPKRNRPKLSSDTRDPGDSAGILRLSQASAPTRGRHMVRRDPPRAGRVSGLERQGACQSRPRATGRGYVDVTKACARRGFRHGGGKFRDMGRSLSALSPDRTAARPNVGVDGFWSARGNRGCSHFSRSNHCFLCWRR
jgi:hypothetical protein